jgi:hypothetical protein
MVVYSLFPENQLQCAIGYYSPALRCKFLPFAFIPTAKSFTLQSGLVNKGWCKKLTKIRIFRHICTAKIVRQGKRKVKSGTVLKQ